MRYELIIVATSHVSLGEGTGTRNLPCRLKVYCATYNTLPSYYESYSSDTHKRSSDTLFAYQL